MMKLQSELGPAGYWQVPKAQVDQADTSSMPVAAFVADPHARFRYPPR